MFNHAPPGYDCPICRLVAGDHGAPNRAVVARTGDAVALVSRRVWGTSPGHVIVLPTQHYENLYDITDDAALAVHRLTRRVAIALKESLGCDGTSTRQHNEPAGNQDLWHYHVHVFPRYEGDGLYGARPRESSDEERDGFAARVRAALG